MSGLASDTVRGPGAAATQFMMRTRRLTPNIMFIVIRIQENNERGNGGRDRVSECNVDLP